MLPAAGWLFWHVEDRVLHYVEGEGFGPMGATADCGSHAGIAVWVGDTPEEPDAGALIIETVPDDDGGAIEARQHFSGPGEHQLIVRVTCTR